MSVTLTSPDSIPAGATVIGVAFPGMIATACSGRKFVIRLAGAGGRTVAVAQEITNGLLTPSQLHLVWWGAWENLLLANDGMSNCFVWDSMNPAFFSTGYDSVNKNKSKVPNAGTVLAYAHAHGIVVVNNRYILASDELNRTDLTSSKDLISFQEQVYWAYGQYFLPPSAMGIITAAEILPLKNTLHGQGDCMFHCEDGVFSIDFNIQPRTEWASSPMVKSALLESGASGPYAIDIYDGDQVFRSRKGIQTLRSAVVDGMTAADSNPVLSNEVNTWFNTDYQRWLRFASVRVWSRGKRIFCTTSPMVRGSYRWHRGFVSRNVDPQVTKLMQQPAWEGLWTLPPEIGGVIQFVSGMFGGKERFFAWCRSDIDGKNRLVEFTDYLTGDILDDGTRREIRSQAITRMIDAGEWYTEREFVTAKLFLRDIRTNLKWSVKVRSNKSPKWVPYRCGTVTLEPDFDELTQGEPREVSIQLGNMPKVCHKHDPQGGRVNEANGVQFLVQWEGFCEFQGIQVTHGENDISKDDVSCGADVSFGKVLNCEYDDFEYNQSATSTF